MRIPDELAGTITGWIRVSVPSRGDKADLKWVEENTNGFWRVDLGLIRTLDDGRAMIINKFYFKEETDAFAFKLQWG